MPYPKKGDKGYSPWKVLVMKEKDKHPELPLYAVLKIASDKYRKAPRRTTSNIKRHIINEIYIK